MAEYTPSEVSVRAAFRLYGGGDSFPENTAEFDRFLARVRRDAARSALDGLAEAMQDTPGIGPGTKDHRSRMRTDVHIYRNRNYPETEDQT